MSLWLLRPAEPWEIPRLAELITFSDSGILEVLTLRSRNVLERLMSGHEGTDSNFSYKHIMVAEKGGEIVGAMFGYDSVTNKRSNMATLKQLWRLHGWARFLWLLPGLLILGVQARFAKGEFYLSNIAVDPAERGSGIGASFLLEIESREYTRIVLDVAEENAAAIRFYERLGYSRERSWWFLGKKYLRMVKVLKKA